jgi:hypothetical protein
VYNGLSGFPTSRLKDIKGDYNDYILWLKDKFYYSTYDTYGNCLTYKNSKGYSCDKTYDSYGNCLTSKDFVGNEFISTYTSTIKTTD